jgi:hypothetical protein
MKKYIVVIGLLLLSLQVEAKQYRQHFYPNKHMSQLVQVGVTSATVTVPINSRFQLPTVAPLNSVVQGQELIIQGTDASTGLQDSITTAIYQIFVANNVICSYGSILPGDTYGTGVINPGAIVYALIPTSTNFTPEKFITFQGQTWVRDTDGNFYLYGGSTNQAFDTTMATVITPWLDLKKPTVRKQGKSVDVACSGQWTISASMDFNGVTAASDSLKVIGTTLSSPQSPTPVVGTFQDQEQSWTEDGFHVQLQATSTDPTALGAVISQFVVNYEECEEK